MKWNVYLDDVNSKEIKVFDVFSHANFQKEVSAARKNSYDKEHFERLLKHIALYHFWSKCEYEVVITSWPPYISRFEANQIKQTELPKYRTAVNLETGLKISVYDQLMLNWDAFVDYCWNTKKASLKVRARRVC